MLGRSVTEMMDAEAASHNHGSCCPSGHDHSHAKMNLGMAVFGGILLVNSALAEWFVYTDRPYISTISAVIGALILALPIFRAAFSEVLRGKVYMNELVALALFACFVRGHYQEAGIIAFFMLLAITIEERTAIGAKTSIEELVRLTPRLARRIDVHGQETEVSARELVVGDIIRVRPGENFPADGVIEKGSSTVNQASITGESLPVDKESGADVYAGTENLTGSIEVRVTGVGEDTTLGKVRDLIEAAERTRLPIMRMVDQYAVYYTPTIIMIAAVVWFFNQDDMMRVVFVLVIACPCALVVATPSAIIAAIAAAARLGMLIKNVAHIETAARIKAVVFDKTGTLTKGNLEVARLNPADGVELADLLHVAVSAESQSNHPAAKAMRRLAEEATVTWDTPTDFTEYVGKGVEAHCGGAVYRVGREVWFMECGLDVTPFATAVNDTPDSVGMSIIYVARDQEVLGWIGLRDAVRDAASQAVAELNELGVAQFMVTGDNQSVASVVAREIGIREVKADCLPAQKVDYVDDLKKAGYNVAVVGDGVNDAPALAAGDIGVAMGAIGSDIAVNSASIALMNNDLRRIPFLIALARKTRTVINLNLLFGVFLIVGGLVLFIFFDQSLDSVTDWFNRVIPNLGASASTFKAFVAAIIHIFGTLIVVFNSARLVRFGETLDTIESS